VLPGRAAKRRIGERVEDADHPSSALPSANTPTRRPLPLELIREVLRHYVLSASLKEAAEARLACRMYLFSRPSTSQASLTNIGLFRDIIDENIKELPIEYVRSSENYEPYKRYAQGNLELLRHRATRPKRCNALVCDTVRQVADLLLQHRRADSNGIDEDNEREVMITHVVKLFDPDAVSLRAFLDTRRTHDSGCVTNIALSIATYLEDLHLVTLLLDAGGRPWEPSAWISSSFEIAVKSVDDAVLEAMISRGPPVGCPVSRTVDAIVTCLENGNDGRALRVAEWHTHLRWSRGPRALQKIVEYCLRKGGHRAVLETMVSKGYLCVEQDDLNPMIRHTMSSTSFDEPLACSLLEKSKWTVGGTTNEGWHSIIDSAVDYNRWDLLTCYARYYGRIGVRTRDALFRVIDPTLHGNYLIREGKDHDENKARIHLRKLLDLKLLSQEDLGSLSIHILKRERWVLLHHVLQNIDNLHVFNSTTQSLCELSDPEDLRNVLEMCSSAAKIFPQDHWTVHEWLGCLSVWQTQERMAIFLNFITAHFGKIFALDGIHHDIGNEVLRGALLIDGDYMSRRNIVELLLEHGVDPEGGRIVKQCSTWELTKFNSPERKMIHEGIKQKIERLGVKYEAPERAVVYGNITFLVRYTFCPPRKPPSAARHASSVL
jgi:hypothetical protein